MVDQGLNLRSADRRKFLGRQILRPGELLENGEQGGGLRLRQGRPEPTRKCSMRRGEMHVNDSCAGDSERIERVSILVVCRPSEEASSAESVGERGPLRHSSLPDTVPAQPFSTAVNT